MRSAPWHPPERSAGASATLPGKISSAELLTNLQKAVIMLRPLGSVGGQALLALGLVLAERRSCATGRVFAAIESAVGWAVLQHNFVAISVINGM